LLWELLLGQLCLPVCRQLLCFLYILLKLLWLLLVFLFMQLLQAAEHR
jgi:hypothetical protein